MSSIVPVLDEQRAILERQLIKLQKGVTSWAFGYRQHPITGVSQLHNGVDLPAPAGSKIYAPVFGMVDAMWEDRDHGGGISLVIRHSMGPWARTGYAHLSGYAPGLKVGTGVRAGQWVALVGSTGASTGPHLHFTARALDVSGALTPVDPLGILCVTVGIVELPEVHPVG